jgi:hypothetical protein
MATLSENGRNGRSGVCHELKVRCKKGNLKADSSVQAFNNMLQISGLSG